MVSLSRSINVFYKRRFDTCTAVHTAPSWSDHPHGTPPRPAPAPHGSRPRARRRPRQRRQQRQRPRQRRQRRQWYTVATGERHHAKPSKAQGFKLRLRLTTSASRRSSQRSKSARARTRQMCRSCARDLESLGELGASREAQATTDDPDGWWEGVLGGTCTETSAQWRRNHHMRWLFKTIKFCIRPTGI